MSKQKQGFTIIEVVLVLAIAGLIFLMVFIALPALQRSQRDTQRRNDLSRMAAALTQFQANNGGKLPSGTGGGDNGSNCATSSSLNDETEACKFIKNYMNVSGATSNEFKDPDGTPYGLGILNVSSSSESRKNSTDENLRNWHTSSSTSINHRIILARKSKCGADGNGHSFIDTGKINDYVLLYPLEGAGIACVDNQ